MAKKSTKKAETRRPFVWAFQAKEAGNTAGVAKTLLDLLPEKAEIANPATLAAGVYTVKVVKVEQTADGKNVITLQTLGDSPVPSEEKLLEDQ